MLSDVVGGRLRKLREERGLTREQLADECAKAGLKLTGAALSKIETGRRDVDGRRRREVTVDELAVLSFVLGVAPVVLLLPIESDPAVEILPGTHVNTAEALAWICGDRSLGLGPLPDARIQSALRLYTRADQRALELLAMLDEWGPPTKPRVVASEMASAAAANAEIGQNRPAGWGERYDATIGQLREYRSQLQSLGHPPPMLPLVLQWIDSGRTMF